MATSALKFLAKECTRLEVSLILENKKVEEDKKQHDDILLDTVVFWEELENKVKLNNFLDM